MLCMMLFINADVSDSPYAKLLGTILAPLRYYACYFWNLKIRIKTKNLLNTKNRAT